MILSIAVYGSPDCTHAARSALRFIEAALLCGHSINRVFFYHDGVMTADNKNASDSEDLRENWRVLSSKFQIELAICIGAASRRGLIGDDPNDRHRLDPAFQVVGLGQLVEAITSSDRFITFAP